MDREHRLRRKRQLAVERKLAVLTHYGPDGKLQCSWKACRITDSRMLVLDHIGGTGATHRRQIGRSSTTLFRWIIQQDYPRGFRTLCCNHNALDEWMRRRIRRKHEED